MKTPHQKKFEKLVTSIILCDPCIQSRAGVLEDFKLESDRYYDIFCDKVFEIARKHEGSLMIDERGLACSEERPKTQHHVYFRVLSDEDLETEADDIIVYIEMALQHLEEQLNQIQNNFL